MPRYLWWAIGAIAAQFAVPPGPARSVVHLVLNTVAAAAAVVGVARLPSARSLPWWAVCAACIANALGNVALTLEAFGVVTPVTSAWEVGSDLATAGLACAGALLFLLVRHPGRERDGLVDAGIVLLAAVLLTMAGPFPAFLDTERVLGIAIAATMTVIIAGGGLIGFHGRTRPVSLVLLLIAAALSLSGSLCTLVYGADVPRWVDAAYLLAPAFVAAAALHPSMVRLVEPIHPPERRIGPVRLVVLGAALLVNPAVAIAANLTQGRRGVLVGVGVTLLTVLVLARIGGLLAERERIRAAYLTSERRFEALVQHAFDVIAVVGADGLVVYISPSAEQVLHRKPDWCVNRRLRELVCSEDVAVLELALRAARDAPSAVSRAEVRLDSADGEVRWGDVLLANRLADPSVGGIVVNLRDVTERKRAEIELSRLALHDALTGLPNRVRFLERVAAALDHGGRRVEGTAVLFCDLDGFKEINDRYGHDLGDRLLRAVAERLREALREHDEPARLGGDEFVVLCTGVERDQAVVIAARLRARLSEPFALRGREVRVGCSIGIAAADRPGVLPEELLQAADQAMYRAKRLGTGVAVHRWSDDVQIITSDSVAPAAPAG